MDKQADVAVDAMLRLSQPKRRMWQPDEDNVLTSLVQAHGATGWTVIADAFVERTGVQRNGKQCRERWCDHLDPDLITDTLTEEEKKTLHALHEKFGTQWTEYREHMPHRSSIWFKNFINGDKRRKRRHSENQATDRHISMDSPR